VSLTDFLEFVSEELESGHAIIDEYGICGHSLFHIEPYAQPMHFSSVLATLHDQGKFDGRCLNVDDTKEKTEPLPPDVLDKLRRVHDAAADDRFGDVWDLLNADPSLTEHPGPYGDTLLHSAASGRSPRILEYLAQFGLDPDAKNDRGETPLMTCKASFRVTCDVREPSS
jgi:hypothetical protein